MGQPIEKVSSFKYLGVTISDDLTWSKHIQTISYKARRIVVMLYRQFYRYTSTPALLHLYKMWYYGLASYRDSMYSAVWHPQQDSQRSDVVAAYTSISTHRTGSTMTTGMTITISIKVITITDNSCHISPSSQSLWRPNRSACT